MKRKRTYLVFLSLTLLWLGLAQQRTLAEEVSCQSGNALAIVAPNFYSFEGMSPSNNWVCAYSSDYSSYACSSSGQLSTCNAACDWCGGNQFQSSNGCNWNRTAGTAPSDQYALVNLGCSEGQYGHRFYLECNCTLPSCYTNGNFCTLDSQCCSNFCNVENSICGSYSPILIDLARSDRNYDLTSAQDGVLFDIDALGQVERVAWTRPDTLVALLAMDRNGNGTIDNGSELFGTATKLRNGENAPNGFDALADLDSNGDGAIDEADPAFDGLRFWLDRNHDGVSSSQEMLTPRQARVVGLSTRYRESRRVDDNGNRYIYVGVARVVQKQQEHRRAMFDVLLSVQR